MYDPSGQQWTSGFVLLGEYVLLSRVSIMASNCWIRPIVTCQYHGIKLLNTSYCHVSVSWHQTAEYVLLSRVSNMASNCFTGHAKTISRLGVGRNHFLNLVNFCSYFYNAKLWRCACLFYHAAMLDITPGELLKWFSWIWHCMHRASSCNM